MEGSETYENESLFSSIRPRPSSFQKIFRGEQFFRKALCLLPNTKERSNSISASLDLYRTFGTTRTNLFVKGSYTSLNHTFASQTQRTQRDGTRTLQRLRRNRRQDQRRSQSRLHTVARTPGRHYMAVTPLHGARRVERQSTTSSLRTSSSP